MCVKHKQITHHSRVILFALLHHMHSNKPCSGLHSFTNAHMSQLKTSHGLFILENVEHCGGEPEQAAKMHMNRLSFTLK